MKLLWWTNLCLLSLTIASCGINKNPPDADYSQKFTEGNIVNGKSETSKDHLGNSIVAIILNKKEGQALCTGSIISENTILTAAHCVDDNPESVKIIFDKNIKNAKSEFVRDADQYIQHPNWNKHQEYGEADLAIIHFSGKLPSHFIAVKLADEKLDLKAGQKVIIAGYGVTNGITRTESGILRKANTEILDRRSETELVVDGQKSSVCFGDSGGPSFIKNKNDIIQWGVASSVSNQECNEISVHTEVMKYKSWINSTIEKMNIK